MADIQKAAIDSILAEIPEAASEGAADWGNPFPLAMSDCETVLVLGCGAGRDAFVAGKLGGPNCHIIGIEYDEAHVKKALEDIPGVTAAVASHTAATATVTLSEDVDEAVLRAAVEALGYKTLD